MKNDDTETRAAKEAAAVGDDQVKCRAERDEYLDGWKRAKADLANYKREEADRFERFAKLATEDLMSELTAVMDSFDLGIRAVQADSAAAQGMMLIRSQFETVLARRGLERLAAPPGTPFDPTRHEAVGDVAGQGPPGTVHEEVSAGFLLHGKVLRPARVIITSDTQSAASNQ